MYNHIHPYKNGNINVKGECIMNDSMGMILYVVVIIAVFYFVLIRPQKKKDKEQKDMVSALKKGDKIVTIGGFHAKVVSSKNGVITVMLGENKVKIEDWAVRSVEKTDENAASAEETETEETEESAKGEE